MNDKDYWDKVIKSAIDDSILNVKASRDIFNEAWNEKEKEMSKRKYFNMRYIKKVVLVPACCAAFALVGVFTVSPGARVAAQDALRTIFLIDKSGKLEEKSEDTEMVLGINGTKPITNENKEDMERKLDFKINLPEKIGEYRLGKYLYGPQVNIVASGVKYKDNDNIRDKLKKAIDDDKVFEELEKDYKMSREIDSAYINNQQQELHVWLSKDSGEAIKDYEGIVKEVNINDTECIVVQGHHANYGTTINADGYTGSDMEHKPTSIEEFYTMYWKYDGVRYQVIIGKEPSDIETAIVFAKDYIKILKQK